MDNVTFKEIPAYRSNWKAQHYYAGSDGHIYSSKKWQSNPIYQPGTMLPLSETINKKGTGYAMVEIILSTKLTIRCLVHRLVLMAFDSIPDESIRQVHGRHLDGNTRNNKPDNLAWGTAADNMGDTKQHGNIKRGCSHHNSKFTPSDIIEIQRLYDNGMTLREIAKRYNVCMSTICKAKNTYGNT